jgi:hypothetical protein
VAVVFGAPDSATPVDWPDDDEAGEAGVPVLAVVTSSLHAVSARQAATIAIIANRGRAAMRVLAYIRRLENEYSIAAMCRQIRT